MLGKNKSTCFKNFRGQPATFFFENLSPQAASCYSTCYYTIPQIKPLGVLVKNFHKGPVSKDNIF